MGNFAPAAAPAAASPGRPGLAVLGGESDCPAAMAADAKMAEAFRGFQNASEIADMGEIVVQVMRALKM